MIEPETMNENKKLKEDYPSKNLIKTLLTLLFFKLLLVN